MATLGNSFLIGSPSFLQKTSTCKKICMSSNFCQIPLLTSESTYHLVDTLAPSFLIRSSLFLQVMRTAIKLRTSSKFDQIPLWTAELAALEHLEKSP